MAVDITSLFRASVKTVKTRNKAIGVGFDSTPKDEIFKRSRAKGGFSPKAKEVSAAPLSVSLRSDRLVGF
ncbi:Syntaxin-18 [Liparis tanakae]|uniref:Syntaxin-18 n=1 Tax=Liparis tanakae TaxID=230148 RepID=A0A4Z2GD21_9TELE|nr:Syntaxin-18 [Liparis tanakae]